MVVDLAFEDDCEFFILQKACQINLYRTPFLLLYCLFYYKKAAAFYEIVLDGTPYTVTFNIRDKGKEQYEYLLKCISEIG